LVVCFHDASIVEVYVELTFTVFGRIALNAVALNKAAIPLDHVVSTADSLFAEVAYIRIDHGKALPIWPDATSR
jgi:hypothetical protein